MNVPERFRSQRLGGALQPELSELATLPIVASMGNMRTLTASEAKANLGEVLASLGTEGPVEITRNGRSVAVISAAMAHQAEQEPPRLAELARLYAAGKVTWRQIADETGVAFGELLEELGRQNLRLPRVVPQKAPAQARLFEQMLQRAAAAK